MYIFIAATVGLFFGIEIGYTWANGVGEPPQVWAVIAGVLALGLVSSIAWR